LRKLEYLLKGVQFTLLTDHKNLVYLNEEKKEKVKRWKIAIQDYDFILKYIKGKDNPIADGLSRFVEADSEDTPLTLSSIEISNSLNISTINITDVIIPKQYYKILSGHHNCIVSHGGVKSTIALLKKHGHRWHDMRKHVEAFIKRCPVCQKTSVTKSHAQIEPFTLASYEVMDRIAMDTMVNLPMDKEGYKHLIVIVDAFSRWVELYKVKDLTAEPAVKALTEWVGRFGVPSAIVSDNGTQFVNEAVTGLLETLNIEHLRINAYSHEENGMVERANKEVKRHLRNIVFKFKNRKGWSDYLPLVARIINTTKHSATGYKPSEILYGEKLDLSRNLYPSKLTTVPKRREGSVKEYLSELEEAHNEIVELARKSQRELDANNRASRMPDSITEFEIGQTVVINYEGDDHKPPTSMHTYKKGPYRITGKLDGNVYTTSNCSTGKEEQFHVSLLHPFYYVETEIDPKEVAMHDDELRNVKKVVDHTFIGTKKQTKDNLELKIKFEGDKEAEWNAWIKEYNHVTAIQDYFKSKGLGRFLLPQYK
jgi:transposase InsO family protein